MKRTFFTFLIFAYLLLHLLGCSPEKSISMPETNTPKPLMAESVNYTLLIDGKKQECRMAKVEEQIFCCLSDLQKLLEPTFYDFSYQSSYNKALETATLWIGTEKNYTNKESDGIDLSTKEKLISETVSLNGKPCDFIRSYWIEGLSYVSLKDFLSVLEMEYKMEDSSVSLVTGITAPEITDFAEVLSFVNAERKEMLSDESVFEDVSGFFQRKASPCPVTKEEIDSVKTGRKTVIHMKPEDAKEDVSLFFRLLKYAYGAYYYYDEDLFAGAEDSVMEKLDRWESEEVRKSDLFHLLDSSLTFLRDAHFQLDSVNIADNPDNRYEYYYSNTFFAVDGKGYYAVMDGEKYYYTSLDNENASMELSLTKDGKLGYSLVQFCPVSMAHCTDLLTLEGESKVYPFHLIWKLSDPFKKEDNDDLDIRYFQNEETGFLSIRSFNSQMDVIDRDYAPTGQKLRKTKALIYDLRANIGGDDLPAKKWTNGFTKANCDNALKGIWSRWNNALNGNKKIGSEILVTDSRKKTSPMKNEVLTFILMDDQCGSSGESAMIFAKNMENSMVIGGNSAGYRICGNVEAYYLPKSGLHFSFGQNLSFDYSTENIDAKGYAPDIWINPADAAEGTANMILRYNLVSQKEAEELYDFLQKNDLIS